MHLSYPLLTVAVALWSAGAWIAPEGAPPGPSSRPLGLEGSAYGSLAARLMRDALYTYWHGGEKAPDTPPVAASTPQPPPPPTPGIFARRGAKPPPPPPPLPEASPDAPASLLDRGFAMVNQLESARLKRQGAAAGISAAHRRFLNASATWRLRLAFRLDPGDAMLYEILHAQLIQSAPSPEAGLAETRVLAQDAVKLALSPEGGLSEALTGAGAAINLLSDVMQPGRPGGTPRELVRQHWDSLDRCLDRYQALREQARREGWWEGIPAVRRDEFDSHARFLQGITVRLEKRLGEAGMIIQASSH